MKETPTNIWEFVGYAHAICVPTNGVINSHGRAVMGIGLAKQATKYAQKLSSILGHSLATRGNIVAPLTLLPRPKLTGTWTGKFNKEDYEAANYTMMVSFPTKPGYQILESENDFEKIMDFYRKKEVDLIKVGATIPGWMFKTELSQILKSIEELIKLTELFEWKHVILPKVGCGFGELDYSELKNAIQDILDDRFIISTFSPGRKND